jgi:hypothetical protein
MTISAYIFTAAIIHLAAFISYPMSGKFGHPFLYISILIWSAFAIFISTGTASWGGKAKAGLALAFALSCAFSALAFLPQNDGKSALGKLFAGSYPDSRAVYIGLLRLGVDAPRLLPPAPEEKPI